ncbi:methyltransferase [Jatrophihabitans telluris]|uniref:Methyltransferase n=1 Tax=Jatrophihabitans telluris TaxID=2038343 RepID=A0ABY4QS42_9ACTN|nr:methyltransferase [Jatrophihabitans telluris]UQX86718.1 methyltransferase [Jatrophihabitans telluris]
MYGAPRPLLPQADLMMLTEALNRWFSSVATSQALGLAGQAALARGDLDGAARAVRDAGPTGTWVRLFVLGAAVGEAEAAAAISPWSVDAAVAVGVLERRAGQVHAALDVRPYSEAGGPDWWVVSDLGADVRPGVLRPDHVLGIGAAATTLAQATMRAPVARALDIGTGCGVQSLHLSRYAGSITATDISERALRMAAATAAINGIDLDLRRGSLLEPVAGERFDAIVCNPPFIVGPGFSVDDGGFTYRDSGMAGDSVSEALVRGLPALLNPGGRAQLLANWAVTGEEEWSSRLQRWLTDSRCAAWVWQREVADPAEYVSLWLRDSGEQPGSPAWTRRYEAWLDWFETEGVLAVGMGLVSMVRTGEAASVVCEDLPQAYEPFAGDEIEAWFYRHRWLGARDDAQLLRERVTPAAGLVLEDRSLLGTEGWVSALTQLRQSGGLRWELEVDPAMAGLVAATASGLPLGALVDVLAATNAVDPGELAGIASPMLRDLVQRGFLLPVAQN